MARLNEIIQEVVDSYLMERYSLSNEVLETVDSLITQIQEKYDNKDWEEYTFKTFDGKVIPWVRLVIQCNLPQDSTFSSLKTIEVRVFNFDSYEDMVNNAHVIGIGGTSYVQNGTIQVICGSINGVLRDQQIKPILSHELEHNFQNEKGGIRKDYKNWYNTALNDIDNAPKDSVEYLIARLIYFFNQQEIDAKMHELYYDLKSINLTNPNDITNCTVIKEKNYYINKIYKKLMQSDQNVINEILKNEYKTKRERFFQYLQKQIHYFDKKTMRVMMEYFRRKEIDNKPTTLIKPR